MTNVIKVGIFFTVALAVLAYLVIEVEDLSPFTEQVAGVEAIFDSVEGLDRKAPVRMAGVRVGTVEDITLDGRRARVLIDLEQSIPLNEGIRARITNAGILGDKYVELIPGPDGATPLAQGALIPGETAPSIDQALESFSGIGESIEGLTEDLRQENIGDKISRLLDNLEATSASIRDLVDTNRTQVDNTIANFEVFSTTLARELPAITSQLQSVLGEIQTVVDDNRDELAGSLENIETLTVKLQTTADNLNDISTQISSGEGTLGKLVYDDQAHDSLVSTLGSIETGVDGLTETLGRVQRLQFDFGLEGALYSEDDESRAAFSLEISPPETSRFYRVAIVDTPGGSVDVKTDIITTTFDDGRTETETRRRRTIEDDYTISAQLGLAFDRFRIRAGLIESEGGAAIDYDLLERRLRFTLEAFDFDRVDDLDPHLRLTGRYRLTDNLSVIGGWDDFLLDDNDAFFIGASLTWRDEDLKYLLGAVPLGGF
ncbi:MAG: MlaD family protein [Acidobacteriota bacterium]